MSSDDPFMSMNYAQPQIISLDDITNSIEVLKQNEETHKNLLNNIATLPYETIKQSLIQWALSNYKNCFTIYEIEIHEPSICSDGIFRNLDTYIQFCSGKTIHEHIHLLQARMKDIIVGFAYTGSSILINVSK